MIIYKHEMKQTYKSLLIWIICVATLCSGCILLYSSLQASLQDVAKSYSQMGAMSTAIGLDKLSIATMTGFYASEIALMHGLGGAMFASIQGVRFLSKEEAGHTTEFLNVLPISKTRIVIEKYLALLSHVLIFNLICASFYLLSMMIVHENINIHDFMLFHFMQIIMQIEIASLCFFSQHCQKRFKWVQLLG